MKTYKNPNKKYHLYLMKRLLRTARRGQFIEIGCGQGFITKLLFTMGWRGQGIDIAPEAISQARQLHPEIRHAFRARDAFSLKESKSYDLVVLADMLEHVADDRAVLNIATRLLKPHGLLLLSVPAHQSSWSPRDESAGHFRRYEKKDLIRQLHSASFDINQFYSLGFPIFDPLISLALRTVLKNNAPDPGWLCLPTRERSEKSGYRPLVKDLSPFWEFWFNPVLIRPLFWIQNLWLHTDRGESYLVLAQKNAVS